MAPRLQHLTVSNAQAVPHDKPFDPEDFRLMEQALRAHSTLENLLCDEAMLAQVLGSSERLVAKKKTPWEILASLTLEHPQSRLEWTELSRSGDTIALSLRFVERHDADGYPDAWDVSGEEPLANDVAIQVTIQVKGQGPRTLTLSESREVFDLDFVACGGDVDALGKLWLNRWVEAAKKETSVDVSEATALSIWSFVEPQDLLRRAHQRFAHLTSTDYPREQIEPVHMLIAACIAALVRETALVNAGHQYVRMKSNLGLMVAEIQRFPASMPALKFGG